MNNDRKSVLVLAGVASLVAILLVSLVIYSFFTSSKTQKEEPVVTPTPVPYQRNESGKFIFTPLAKTEIGTTTEKDIEKNQTVVSKTITGTITTYKVKSKTPDATDEIKTQGGVVIFESNNIFNKAAGYPPKLDVYQKEFGNPEKIIEDVSPLGPLSAYIYAKKGFTLFVNPYTKTVYQIERYVPMSIELYEKKYPEFLKPAPTPQPEYFK